MIVLHVDPTDKKSSKELREKNVEQLNDFMSSPSKQLFILFFMEGCIHCQEMHPEWKKIQNDILDANIKHNNNIVVADVEMEYIDKLKHLKKKPVGFPTMYYIANNGELIENYEDSDIENKDRQIESFVNWIQSKNVPRVPRNPRHPRKTRRRTNKRRKHKRGGKWSLKYKKSINCKRPKGFSQKQYCKYGRK